MPHRAAPVVMLTMGDPAGVGPEIALKAWALRETLSLRSFCYVGDARALSRAAADLGLAAPIHPIADEACAPEAADVFQRAIPVLDTPLAVEPRPGEPDHRNADAVLAAIERAVRCVASGQAGALVTNPIAKHVLQRAGFPHPGHTEYLGALARRKGRDAYPVMMLAGPDLRVAPLTIHIPLSAVAAAVTPALIDATAKTLSGGLSTHFGIERPRIAVCGLNPHAGENGMLGDEETRVIAPAIAALRAEGLAVTGPHSADTLFHAAARRTYDAAIAMYHDQALLPVKTLYFDEAVNVTLGLPFIRTSPDHGVAFDIAGRGLANPASLIAAIRMAHGMAARANARSAKPA
ncbi:MAG: 4-hydroxythreonine-4-phosphate dehydrogenase PdxA [Hyphomicrobiales bacterium]|nr:4-hydroxythreonine-4-phosphate dehydrogenase PdxA [Hyphomicrobiales bacterium]